MDSPFPCVIDAGILFDVSHGGIVHEVFHLPIIFVTSDLIADRELINPPFSLFKKAGLRKKELSGPQTQALLRLRHDHKNLSVYDISAFLLARDRETILLTGDDALRTFATSFDVEVHGILWILDYLIQEDLITELGAAVALEQIIVHNSYLPKKECRERISHWRK
jgi:predicted nucleic acid-binding protein